MACCAFSPINFSSILKSNYPYLLQKIRHWIGDGRFNRRVLVVICQFDLKLLDFEMQHQHRSSFHPIMLMSTAFVMCEPVNVMNPLIVSCLSLTLAPDICILCLFQNPHCVSGSESALAGLYLLASIRQKLQMGIVTLACQDVLAFLIDHIHACQIA